MQFGHALNGASGMPVPGMSQSLNPVEEMDHRFVYLLLSIVCCVITAVRYISLFIQ